MPMLFRWFLLLLIAYLIYRALRNLIDASMGRSEDRQQFRKHRSQDSVNIRPPHREEARRKEDNPDDIEDAKWTDI